MTASRPLRVVVTDGWGRRVTRRGLSRWLTGVAPASARGVLAVALVSDDKMRQLNRSFRGIDRPTDVLSFPATAAGPVPVGAEPIMGDVVIATGVARRQAARAGHSMETEVRRLALHGLLHVLGYDHERDSGQMVRLERRLLRKGGLAGAWA